MTGRKSILRRCLPVLALLAGILLGHAVPADAADAPKPAILVFAASSLTDAMTALGNDYEKSSGVRVTLSFAASSTLASRTDVVGNRLVLIAPADAKVVTLEIAPHFALAAALGNGRLATGDPDSVPVGRYARAALIALGVWDSVADRLIRAENVRVALAFVARGEAPLGIVYATDARVEPRVRVVAVFPEETQAPITYPLALTNTAAAQALPFVTYLRSAGAAAVFRKYGFDPR